MITCPCYVDPPYAPLLPHSKTGVYRGIYYFLMFALKHRSWVLVRTASGAVSEAVLTCTLNLRFGQNMKNITNFHLKITIFTQVKITVYYIGLFS